MHRYCRYCLILLLLMTTPGFAALPGASHWVSADNPLLLKVQNKEIGAKGAAAVVREATRPDAGKSFPATAGLKHSRGHFPMPAHSCAGPGPGFPLAHHARLAGTGSAVCLRQAQSSPLLISQAGTLIPRPDSLCSPVLDSASCPSSICHCGR